MISATGLPIDELAEEAAFCWLQRSNATRAPHYSRAQFAALDERLASQLDALLAAGAGAPATCIRALDAAEPTPEAAFVAAVTMANADAAGLDAVVAGCRGFESAAAGLTSALGWLGWSSAQEIVARLVATRIDADLRLALRASRLHRQEPGPTLLEHGARAEDVQLRAQAARLIGELGKRELVPLLHDGLVGGAAEPRFHAARSLCLLGERTLAVPALEAFAKRPGMRGRAALFLLLQTLEPEEAHCALQAAHIGGDIARVRVIGTGYVGDTRYVPWLIERMRDVATARIAGEAFVHITGADFNLDQLESMPPDGHDDGPTDDPDDEDVAVPEDIALPWPHIERIQAWWQQHKGGLTPGRKLFLGQPITPEHCVHVLKTGLQRQRVIAAQYRSLIQPGTVLFPTSAPAWRQQRLLASM